jgi:hypothetical protein
METQPGKDRHANNQRLQIVGLWHTTFTCYERKHEGMQRIHYTCCIVSVSILVYLNKPYPHRCGSRTTQHISELLHGFR